MTLRNALVLLATYMVSSRAENADAPLFGLRHRNETTPGTLTKVSMGGGLEMFIDGEGFDDMPIINQVKFKTVQGEPNELAGPPLNQDDQIQSATVLGRLAYSLPSIPQLVGGPIEAINTHYIANNAKELKFEISVANTAEATDSSCGDSISTKCEVWYDIEYTPLVHDIVPNQLYWDQEIDVMVNPQRANHDSVISADMDPVVFIKMSGTRCDSEGFIDYQKRLSNYVVGGLKTRAGDQHPGRHVPEVRFRVGNALLREQSKHCNFAGDDCWYVKTHPKVDTVSAVSGYTTGGQTLKIEGWGLKGDTLNDVEVIVDGVPCAVQSSTLTEITCITGAAAQVSFEGPQPGSPGLRQKIIDPTDPEQTVYWGMRDDYGAHPVVETKLMTVFEDNYGNYTRAATHTNGWFKAPETGNYRFYTSCDDFCKVWFNSVDKFDGTKTDAYTMTQMTVRHWASDWRDYHRVTAQPDANGNQWVSEWVALEQGQFYKIEGFHGEHTSGDHFTVSVEFEKADTTGHHHATKEVQVLEVNHDLEFERFNITIVGSMGGGFKVRFVNPLYDSSVDGSIRSWTSDEIKDNETNRWTVRQRLIYFFSKIWGTNIDVEIFTTNDLYETVASADATQRVFQVRLMRSHGQVSYSDAAIVLSSGTTSTITIGMPHTESSPPLQGRFQIACTNKDGNEFVSREMSIYQNIHTMSMYLFWDIPHLQFKIQSRTTGKYDYRENGLSFQLEFTDLHEDPAQCTIQSGTNVPLTGGTGTLSYDSTTTRPYGQNLMFEPVPLEMLFHDADKPQVMIKVNGLEGVCPEFNCDYLYTSAPSLITGQTLATQALTITGTALPTTDIRIVLGNTECGNIVATDTQITCDLDVLPAAGSWNVELYDPSGLTPIETSVAKIDVVLVVSGVSPATGLNQLGGDLLTLSGTGFDTNTADTTVALSDGTTCTVTGATPTTLNCIPTGFDLTTDASSTPRTMTVTVNSVVNTDQSVEMLQVVQQGLGVSPSSVSPVLSTDLTVTLDSAYPGDMTSPADFTCKLVEKANTTNVRDLYVMAVDATAKTVKIKFPGAMGGVYYLALEGKGVGRIGSDSLELTVEIKMTAISPQQGSYLGGTKLTIDGINFSDKEFTDNPVKVGNYWCLLESTTLTQIVCRISNTIETTTSQADVLVFAKTQEEATRDIGLNRVFDLNAPVATVTGLTSAFDAVTNTEVLTLAGTGFGTDTSAIELLIDGVKQTCLTAADTTATFTLSGLTHETTNSVVMYFPDGYPSGYDTITSVTVTPKLVSISPATGSAGGTLLTVTGTGFGTKTEGVTLDIGGTDICATVEVTGYGSFTCQTKAMEIAASDTIQLKTSAGLFDCANTLNAADCGFSQLTAGSPTVTAASIASNVITLTGTDFPTIGYNAVVSFKGVDSSSAVIDSATQITATFDNGIPVAGTATAPTLSFTPTTRLRMLNTGANQLTAAQDAAITISNALSVSASTTGLSCSFAGGCPYTVTAASLTATLVGSTTDYIDVCGNQCVIDVANSDASQTTCTLPYASTTYSASNYDIVTKGLLHDGTWTGTASDAELAKLIDNNNLVDLADSTSADCYAQVQYKPNHVGVLDEAKIFINKLTNKTPLIGGNLIFQGSNDGTTFTDLWTIDASVHEGWNSIDFDSGSQPAYNIYRFQGKVSGSCRIGEIRLHGIESIDDNNASFSCTPKLMLDGVATDLSPVTFDSTTTPVLTGLSTRFLSVKGGEPITFTGTGFSDTATTTVLIDNRPCTVTAQTTTTITCTSSDKPYVPDSPKLEIHIQGTGNVATMSKEVLYIYRWSDPDTWGQGGDIPPQDGDPVQIPKGQHLLFDIDKSPRLNFINIEGSLIFPPDADPNHVRELDAYFILIKGGRMEVGTETDRYTSKIVITLWGTKYSPNIPIFGNKVIGVNYGTLDMHGIERPITWTELSTTAEAGATSITLMPMQNGAVLDWQVGEEIVIAPTGYSGRDAEQRTIATISNTDTSPVITFIEPLVHKHYAGRQTFGAGTANEDFIDMRAEVGLLTRNVQFRGDSEWSPDNQYGAVIICHSPGDESTTCRIDSVELYHVGQAFILGSYPIHFHMIGTVHSSYVRNNAIHHTFNRAVTIHGVHYLRVQNNVAYHTMGHTIFIEDAVETKNLIENNLILDVRRSWSLLNTDQTPASIWITNPDNIIRGNHAGGSDRYSYWYDLQTTAIGPSFDANVCPENQKLGEFSDNVAHSNGRYGLRIFHNHIPRTHQCKPLNYDDTSADYNPPIIAEYKNLVSWKNKRNGAIVERAGAVHWINFKVADNLEVGMEMSRVDDNKQDGWAQIIGGLAIGKSENTEEALDVRSPVGVRTPRTEYFSMSGVKFYNYNWNNAAGMHTCSHCWHDNNTDSGARTMTVWDLFFDSSVQKRVSYTTPFRTIFFDKTGTLTDKGTNSWFLPYFRHLLQPECTQEDALGGITCDNTVEARRIALFNMPKNFMGMRLKITPFDAVDEAAMTSAGTIQAYLDDEANYGIVPYKQKQSPSEAYAVPYITNHRYRLHWEAGLDFDNMRVEVSERWQPTDQDVRLVFNFTESREAVNITSDYGAGVLVENNTLETKAQADWIPGDMQLRNTTIEGEEYKKEFEFVINGKGTDADKKLKVWPLECIYGKCILESVKAGQVEGSPRSWSFPGAWTSGELPKEGDDVVINATQWFELDIAETPLLNSIEINGRLSFKDDATLPIMKLRAKKIFVRAGNLRIGTKDAPFSQTALVELVGHTESDTLMLGGTIKAGNKVLASSGKVEIYGPPRVTQSRLLATVTAGATQISVDSSVDWKVGEQIYIAPSTIQMDYSEYKTITAIAAGVITLDSPLAFYHYGKDTSTATDYSGVDIRTEVFLLSRSVKVYGDATDNWPAHIMATDMFEDDGTIREGSLIMDNVEVDNCSQKDLGRGCIRWEGAVGSATTYSRISNSAIHNGQDWGLSILSSENIEIVDNVFVGWRAIGARIDKAKNVTVTGNYVGDVKGRNIAFIDMTIDKEACWAVGSYDESSKGTALPGLTFKNNIAGGCPFSGFIAPGYLACGDTNSEIFANNVAHSVGGYGAYVYANPVSTSTSTCMEWSHFAAYKVVEACAVTFVPTNEMRAHHVTCIDVQKGLALNTGGGERDQVKVILEDSNFYGESEADDCPSTDACSCQPKFALMNAQNMNDEKDLMPTMASALPIYNSHGEGNWGGRIELNRNKFAKFLGLSKCGERSVIFNRNPGSSDKIPPHWFTDTVFEDVDDTGFAFLEKSDEKWANIKDCGNFPCTAPNNLIYTFTGTTFSGTQPSSAAADFTIVPNDETVGGTYPNCVHMNAQQIYVCQINNIGMFQFENLDVDGWDRAIQPVFLLNEETGFNNTVNAMMDHIWDTFYTGQRRMPRFPIAMATGQDYTLDFSATPPKKMRFNLDARVGGTKIKIPYPIAGSIAVSVAGTKVEPNKYDDNILAPALLTKDKGCGENRYVGVENYLEFWIEPGCEIHVEPKDSIMAKVRMDWTMAEFFSDGGTTTFVDRLAASLGIPSYRIKVVALYQGSVIVDFQIDPEEPEAVADAVVAEDATPEEKAAAEAAVEAARVAAAQASLDALAAIKTTLVTKASDGDLATAIGAPVMGLQEVPKEEGVEPVVLAGTAVPPAPKLQDAVVFGVKGDEANTFEFKQGATVKAEMKFFGSVSKDSSNYFLTWDFALNLKDSQVWNFPGDADGSAFEMNACVNDGTVTTPWNCAYTIMPKAASASAESTVTTYQKHVAEGDRPLAVAQTDISTISSPACTVAQVYKNGRSSTTFGEKVASGSVATNGNCELATEGTELTANGVKNRVKIQLADEAASTAIKAGFATAYLKGTYSTVLGTWVSFGGQTLALADNSPATLTAKAGAKNVFELKQGETTKAEVTFDGAGTSQGGAFGWAWGFKMDLKDSQKFKFANGAETSILEWNACVKDGTTTTDWRCVYTQLHQAGTTSSDSLMFTYMKNVAEADRPSDKVFTMLTNVQSPTCKVSQQFKNGRITAGGAESILGDQVSGGVAEHEGCAFYKYASDIFESSAKGSMGTVLASEALMNQSKTGLATAWVKAGYAIDGSAKGWVSSVGQTVALLEQALPEAPGGAMGLASAWMALLAALAVLLM